MNRYTFIFFPLLSLVFLPHKELDSVTYPGIITGLPVTQTSPTAETPSVVIITNIKEPRKSQITRSLCHSCGPVSVGTDSHGQIGIWREPWAINIDSTWFPIHCLFGACWDFSWSGSCSNLLGVGKKYMLSYLW